MYIGIGEYNKLFDFFIFKVDVRTLDGYISTIYNILFIIPSLYIYKYNLL